MGISLKSCVNIGINSFRDWRGYWIRRIMGGPSVKLVLDEGGLGSFGVTRVFSMFRELLSV